MRPMRRQGTFWQWADCMLLSQGLNVLTPEGLQLDIQVRTSRQGEVQLFIGIYSKTGAMMVEEYYRDRSGQSLALALNWGEDRARRMSMAGP